MKKGRLILLLATGLISIGLWDSSGVVLAANKPQAGDIHLGGADGSSYRKLINSITFQYSNDAVVYDEGTDTFKIPIRFGSLESDGLDRYLEFGYSFNDALEGKIKRVVISPDGLVPAVITSLNKNREFARRWDGSDGKSVSHQLGGRADAVIYMQAHKIMPEDWIAVRMETNRIEGKHPIHPAFRSTRILEYNDFGPALNAKLLEAMKKKAIDDTAKDPKPVQEEVKEKVDPITVDEDFDKLIQEIVLNAHKEQAKRDIDAEAAKVSAEIEQDPTLTATEKAKQKDGVAAEATKAKAAIDQAQTETGVQQARDAGIAAIDAQHQPGTGLNVRREEAKQAIDAEAAKVTADIEQDSTLATSEKAAQKQGVADEAAKAKTAIDQAQTIEAIDKAKDDGIKAIDAQHKQGADFDTRKAQAKDAIDAEAAKVKDAIDQDPTLTAKDKTAQKQGVGDEATKAKTAIDQAKTIDGVIQAKDDGIKAIDAQHQAGTDLATRKDSAKQAIDAEAAKITDAINQDDTLTSTEKDAQKQAVADEAAKAKAAIDQAQNADAILQAQADGIKAIDAKHQIGADLDTQKTKAKQAIDKEAAKVLTAIEQDPTLTSAEKKAQKQGVADETAKAKTAIDSARNADEIAKAQADGIKAIDAQHRLGMDLAKRKTDAQAAIDAEAAKVGEAIDQDPTLTSQEKAAQKQTFAAEATKAKDTIAKAQDADGVIQAEKAGIQAIDDGHQSGALLDTRKVDAKKAIDAEAAKINDAIDQDVSLTSS